MLTFSMRKNLADKYDDWTEECRKKVGAEPILTAQNVISWLMLEKLLDEDKVIEFLKQ